MWDDAKTDRDTMFGDTEIVEVPGGEYAEIRWRRNIVINPSVLACLSEAPPYVENSVLKF